MNVNFVLVTCALSVLQASSALAQSTFRLQNFDQFSGIDAPVFDAEGNRLAGADYAAELWGSAGSNSLSPTLTVSLPHRVIVPFATGAAAGYFQSFESMAVWNAPAGSLAWVQVRAWDARLGPTYEDVALRGVGGYGESSLLYILGGNPLGVPPTTPYPLTGLQSFSLRPVVPEPSTWALLALGGTAVWLALRRKRGQKKRGQG